MQCRPQQTATAGFYLEAENLTAETFRLPKELELSVGRGKVPQESRGTEYWTEDSHVLRGCSKFLPGPKHDAGKKLLKMIKECSEAKLSDSLVG